MNIVALAVLASGTVAVRYLGPRARRARIDRAHALYERYVGDPDHADPALAELLEQEAAVIARTVRRAPVDPARLSYFDSTDRHPFFTDGEIGILENFLAPRALIRREYLAALGIARQHFLRLERRALDPRVWIGWILLAPRDLLEYLGLHTAGTRLWVTALQLVYWLGGAAALGWWAWQAFHLGRFLPS